MIKVGITGGIGSGKSFICQVFAKLGVPVYYADIAAKELANTDPEIRQSLTSLLGSDIYSGDYLNRSKMASLIFDNKMLLEKINHVIHPKVARHFEFWCDNHSRKPYIIHESAIIFESQIYSMFDKIITISAPEEVRIQRVIPRCDMNRNKILAIMQNQMPESEKIKRSHYVIINDGRSLILPQVIHIHESLMSFN